MGTDIVEVYKARRLPGRRTQWRWRFVAPNGRKLANSGESYANMEDLLNSLATVLGVLRADLIDADVIAGHVTSARFVRAGRAVHVVVKR